MMAKIKCMMFGHKYFILRNYTLECKKLACKRCNKKFGLHHGVGVVLPWDAELEREMKMLYD